jgi:hypothetical protein
MKASIEKGKEFRPFSVIISLETEKDAMNLRTLLNTPGVVTIYGLDDISDRLREQIDLECSFDVKETSIAFNKSREEFNAYYGLDD